GDTRTFTTAPSCHGPFTSHWTANRVVILGASLPGYLPVSVSTGDAGTYCVIVTGAVNSVTNCATLTVNEPTTATGPDDLVLVTGDTGTFSTTPSGTGPFDYQWTNSEVETSELTTCRDTVCRLSIEDAGTYCV